MGTGMFWMLCTNGRPWNKLVLVSTSLFRLCGPAGLARGLLHIIAQHTWMLCMYLPSSCSGTELSVVNE